MKSYTKLRTLFGTLSQNTSSTNLTLGDELINDAHRRILEEFFFNEATATIQQQEYDLPFDYSKLKTGTLTIGQLKWNPSEILTRRDWDSLNVFPYYADIPSNYFIWNENKFNLFPIPSTTGNTITFNYKKRVPDLTFADYVTGTVSATNASATITGSATGWLANYLPVAGSVLNLNLWIQVTSPKGDNGWYQIASIESATSLTLVKTYQGGTTSVANYTIGQMPLLQEDYHDVLVFDALVTYFSSIVDNPTKLREFTIRRDSIVTMMNDYIGTKSLNVNLARPRMGNNPNLYQNTIG
jgi:hypothetical protein